MTKALQFSEFEVGKEYIRTKHKTTKHRGIMGEIVEGFDRSYMSEPIKVELKTESLIYYVTRFVDTSRAHSISFHEYDDGFWELWKGEQAISNSIQTTQKEVER